MKNLATILGTLFILGFNNTGFAQLHSSLNGTEPGQFTDAGLEGSFFAGSSVFTNAFVKTWYTNGFIDLSMKDKLSSAFKNGRYGRFGMDLTPGLYIEHVSDSLLGSHGGFWVTIRENIHADGLFNRDMIDMALRGNEFFAGEKANLSGLVVSYQRYRTFEAGISDRKRSGNGFIYYGMGVGLVQGIENFNLTTSDASSFYTDVDGEYIHPDIQMTLHRCTGGGKSGFNGTGFSGSFFIRYAEANRRSLSLEASDLGMINWNKKSEVIHTDTSFVFDGVNITDVMHIDSSAFAGYDSSLVHKFFRKGTERYSTVIPGRINLRYETVVVPGKLSFGAGTGYRLAASYSMEAYMKLCYSPLSWLHITARAAAGGYTLTSCGLSLAAEPYKTLRVLIGSDNITGSVSPNGHAMTLYAGVQARL